MALPALLASAAPLPEAAPGLPGNNNPLETPAQPDCTGLAGAGGIPNSVDACNHKIWRRAWRPIINPPV
jgi:hypothetical protein